MNATRTLALKKEFFRREGIDYGKETKNLLKAVLSDHPRKMKLPWRQFKKAWKLGRI